MEQNPLFAGGFVMIPLAGCALALWFGLGYRYFLLRGYRVGDGRRKSSFLHETLSEFHLPREWPEARSYIAFELKSFRSLVQAVVIVAPLLGLLGTVTGMIETFASLSEMNLYSQSGGIAGGISKALFTTQLGLVISAPGLLGGRILDRLEDRVNDEMMVHLSGEEPL